MSVYAENRKARYEYLTLETFEGGLALLGHEVKSIRGGGANLTGSYLSLNQGELWLIGAKISPYPKASHRDQIDPERQRKVLIRHQELHHLAGKIQEKGLTLIPFSLYPRGRHIKLSFGLCRGKKDYDKRESLKRKAIDRDVRRWKLEDA